MKNVFDRAVANELIQRINSLNSESRPQWGKMTVGQAMAHCNVTYELVYDNSHTKPNGMVRFMLKLFVKAGVVNAKAYQKNIRTAPYFLVKEDKDFQKEQKRLIDYIDRTQELGEGYFDGKESHSFGALSFQEWNNMFYKHIDHHLNQFGV